MSGATELHVIFGTGPIGRAVGDALVRRGKRVRMINRSGQCAVATGVEVMRGDATDPTATPALCAGAGVVYNCTNAPYTAWPALFPRLQAGVLAGAIAADARLVAMDNLYMYGPTGGRPLTEDLPYSATTRKGRTRAALANELLAAHQAGHVRVAIGRASDYFGPGGLDTAMGERVFGPALTGKPAQVLGKIDQPHTYTYLPDIGEGLAVLGEHDAALGRAWHLPSAATWTTREFLERIYATTGHPPRIQAMPRLLVQGLGLVNPMMRELAEMLYEFDEPFVVDDSRFVAAFGNHATPLPEAIQATVAWFAAQAEKGGVHSPQAQQSPPARAEKKL